MEFVGAEPVQLTALDQLIVRALAANGRDSWATIAQVVGSSPSTVQRRYARLHDMGAIHVVGAVDASATGLGIATMVRIQCGSAATASVVATLSRRPEVRFVSTLTGSADCVAEFVVPRLADLERLLQELLADPSIRTEAVPVLRTFTVPFDAFPGALEGAGEIGWKAATEYTGNAVAPNLEAIEGVVPARTHLNSLERAVVEILIPDGRTPLIDVARAIGRSEATTRRVIDELLYSGRLRIGPLLAPHLLSIETELMLWISVSPDQLGAAARQLAQHSAVHYAAAAAGRYNLIGQVFLADFADLYDFTTHVLGALPGVREVDLTIQMTTHKRMWTPIVDSRFVPILRSSSA
ncbi:Lrp/AsnC family transcriptional regulator [Cryobacterium sp. Y82]|uniref:Lrp/AsnC family transcriptional regulator n=1 Tax=Cryobacterium sp. Y82 TaxID=2045017 RepID=UPI000CE38FA3|nr:Lrp/AsnC family transcriptional regulator [Cryobacterium sp. Y82]